jgi:hypothetical protein
MAYAAVGATVSVYVGVGIIAYDGTTVSVYVGAAIAYCAVVTWGTIEVCAVVTGTICLGCSQCPVASKGAVSSGATAIALLSAGTAFFVFFTLVALLPFGFMQK